MKAARARPPKARRMGRHFLRGLHASIDAVETSNATAKAPPFRSGVKSWFSRPKPTDE